MQVTGGLDHLRLNFCRDLTEWRLERLWGRDHALHTLEHGRVYSVVLPSYLPVSRCFKGCWIPLPQILGSSSSRRMAKGQSGLVPKDPSIGVS